MYAVIESGGKQHKVEKGMTLPVDLLKDEPGTKITFDNVLLYVDDNNVEIGQPYLSNVKVTAEVVDIVKSDKISILRLDTDWYESTKIELEILFPKLVKDGILIIDDYGDYFGCKKAVDDYFKDKKFNIFKVDSGARMLIKS